MDLLSKIFFLFNSERVTFHDRILLSVADSIHTNYFFNKCKDYVFIAIFVIAAVYYHSLFYFFNQGTTVFLIWFCFNFINFIQYEAVVSINRLEQMKENKISQKLVNTMT